MQSLTSQMLLTRLGRAVTQGLMQGADKLLMQTCDETSSEMLVYRGWLKEVITLGQSAVAHESSVSNQHQGDKVHRTARRLLFVSRATRASRDEQLGEHKTFFKASRWVHSRAATGRGAGRAGCRLARARVRAEWLCQ